MNFTFVYDDGCDNLYNEDGLPTIDDYDLGDRLPLRTLVDYTLFQESQAQNSQVMMEEIQTAPYSSLESINILSTAEQPGSNAGFSHGAASTKNPRRCRKNREYSSFEKERFFREYDSRGESASSVAREFNLSPKIVSSWLKKRDAPASQLLRSPGRPRNAFLGTEHKDFIHNAFANDPSMRLDKALEDFTKAFESLKVCPTTFYKFVTEHCGMSFKLARRDSVERNSFAKIELRYEYVVQIREKAIDYVRDCVFLDEAGFSVNMKRSGGWAPSGATPVVLSPSISAQSTSIVGAISCYGVVHLSLREAVIGRKRQRTENGDLIPKTRGTVTGHFKQFLTDLLDSMDKHSRFRNCYLVMDNATIHKNASIVRIITSRGYRCLYLPPYSPELNPIEQFWSVVKSKLKKEHLLSKATLPNKIIEAAISIPPQTFRNQIQHSVNNFEKCLNRIPL